MSPVLSDSLPLVTAFAVLASFSGIFPLGIEKMANSRSGLMWWSLVLIKPSLS